MIQFFRSKNDPGSRDIEGTLRDMSLACEIVTVENKDDIPDSVSKDARPPFMLDEGTLYQGSGAIVDHLNELKAFQKQWYKYQSDVCYCDDDDAVG
jgi:hypothetical protein